MLKTMKIAVTGGSGFIGSNLVNKLNKLGIEILRLDVSNGIDITDWDKIENIGKFDVLFHLAAKSFVPESYKNPKDYFHSNIIGTLNVLELCRKYSARVIFTSSYIYGYPEYLPIDEKHPVRGFNPYSQSKIIGEKLCEGYNRDFGVPVIIIRPFNVYGAGQNSNFLIPLMIKQVKDGGIFLKTSKPRRDFVHVDDVVEAYIKCMEYNDSSFEIFNLGCGISYSVKEIVEMAVKNINHEVSVSFTEELRENEIMNTVADISKAINILGWKPKISLDNGITRLMKDV